MSDAATKNMIKTLLGITDTISVFDAKVLSVDSAKRECTVSAVTGKSANEIKVRLMATVDDGSLLLPKVGSNIIVSFSDHVHPFVSMFSEVESIVWLGGEYEGVPIVKHPTNSNKGLLKKINNLENQINDILQVLKTTTIPLAPSGTYAFASLYASILPLTPITSQTDIEHPNIKH